MDIIPGVLFLGHGVDNDTCRRGLDAGATFRRSMVATDLTQATLLAGRNVIWLFVHIDRASWSAIACMVRTSIRPWSVFAFEEISAAAAEVL